jgi:hypothetical protein
MRTLIDRPHTINNRALDQMVAELSPHMNEFEMDRVVEFMWTIDTSKYDINYTVDDAASQLKIILGSERYEVIKSKWAVKNQHLLNKVETKTKYIHKQTNLVYDGLDETDDPNDYLKLEM